MTPRLACKPDVQDVAAAAPPRAAERYVSGRRRSRTLAAWATAAWAALVASGCGPGPAGPEFQLRQEPWSFGHTAGTHLITDHFDIYTTVDDPKLRDYLPRFLETLHQERYAALLPAPEGSDRRLQTYLFANQHEWMAFTRQHFPDRYDLLTSVQVGGYASGDMCVTRNLRPAIHTLSVIAHEGMHQYFGTHFDQRLPAWLNEGLATYCEGFDVRQNRPVFHSRRNALRLNPLREALAGDTLLPFSELLATDAGRVIIQSQSRLTKTYYAQAWALVVFLQHGGNRQYAEGFRRMLDDVAAGRLDERARAARITSADPAELSFGESVFRAYITEDLPVFEQQLREFITALAFR